MSPLTLVTATLSHPGGRTINEDAAGPADGCWVLADGLGGHGGGWRRGSWWTPCSPPPRKDH